MARPAKQRKVCGLPYCNRFGPMDLPNEAEDYIVMMVDEYECIRLIDLEGFTQEACAKKMDVARTTVQGIYVEARRKLAEALVEGKEIRIQGGAYHLCDGKGKQCGGGGCPKRNRGCHPDLL